MGMGTEGWGVGPGLAVSFFCSVDKKVDGVLSCMDVN